MKIWTDQITGPASYEPGGFTVVTGLEVVQLFRAEIRAAGMGLGAIEVGYQQNLPTPGEVVIAIKRRKYSKLTAVGGILGLPAEVIGATNTDQLYDDDITHQHSVSHDHAVTAASGPPQDGLGGTLAAPAQPNHSQHTHTLDLPPLSHVLAALLHWHLFRFIYQHNHQVVALPTDLMLTELAAGTSLSGVTFDLYAVGI